MHRVNHKGKKDPSLLSNWIYVLYTCIYVPTSHVKFGFDACTSKVSGHSHNLGEQKNCNISNLV